MMYAPRRSCSATGKIVFRFAVALLALSPTIVHADGPGKTLAVYGDAAVAKTPPPGWGFLWNASGKVGDSKGYSPLSYVEKARAYGVMDENGALKPDAPSHNMSRDFFFLDISAMRDKEGIARFYIASYTLAEDPAGEVWINNGNLRNQAFREGTALEIYVNDELKSQSLCKQDRFATVFQENLGRLKKGDAIRVAVGPGEKSPQGGGRLFFTIEEYPAGEKPAAPIPILTPPLNAVNPELGADGKIHRVYAAKHQAQCKALLANNPELVFIGDSITARWPAELLQEKFGAFRPANLGMGGDGIQNVLWRLQNGVLDQIRAKVIVLLIGTNNITIGLTPDQIAEGIATLLKAIQEKAPASKILLLGILPRGESIQEANNEKIRQTNAKLALLADNKRIFYLDVGDKLVEPDGSISKEIMPDKLHVAAPGYARWMDAMKPTLDKLLNESDLLPSLKRQVIVPQTPTVQRSGEATTAVLKNGEILLIYSRFTGGDADHDTADLFGGILDPLTGEIRDGRVFFHDAGAVNQMNPGLARLSDGALGIIFLRRTAKDECDLYFSRSADEGMTWSPQVKINSGCSDKFINVNSDRLRQLSSGRLAVPAALYPDFADENKPCSLAMFYSDDGGATWSVSERLKILEKNIAPPHAIHPEAGQAWKEGCEYYAKEQEPGVEELSDGRLLLYCRTTAAYMYQAYSANGGETWSEMKAATDLVSPCSPQSIRRIPGSRRLLCVFNNRRHIAFADTERFWSWRTPLSLAVSDDDASTWRILGNIEDESHNYCYTSMLFFDGEILLTYYESENSIKDGKPERRSLASLKMQLLDLETICRQ